MTWTNVRIPDRFDTCTRLTKEISFLEFKLDQKQAEIDLLYKELENIFESLKKNKEINLSYMSEKITARLVKTTGE